MKQLLAAILALTIPAIAGAQPTVLSGVTSTPPVKCRSARLPPDRNVPAPKVVSTFPAQGAVVRPGKLIIRITFDLPMACGGTFVDAAKSKSPLPDGDRWVAMTPDLKTLRIVGYVAKGRLYGLRMNPAPVHDFLGLSGQPLEPYDLFFTTSSGQEVKTEAEALAEDRR